MFCFAPGVLSIVMKVFSIVGVLDPSGIAISLYCLFFGVLLLAFEFSNSPKISLYFRTNFGFFMTYNGRAAFLFFIGFFSFGAGGSGAVAGVVAFLDSLFHVYCRFKNPGMKEAIRHEDEQRLEGTYQASGKSGMMGKMVDMAADDPNKLAHMGKMGAGMAGGMAAGGGSGVNAATMGMAAMQMNQTMNAPSPAPAPVRLPSATELFSLVFLAPQLQCAGRLPDMARCAAAGEHLRLGAGAGSATNNERGPGSPGRERVCGGRLCPRRRRHCNLVARRVGSGCCPSFQSHVACARAVAVVP